MGQIYIFVLLLVYTNARFGFAQSTHISNSASNESILARLVEQFEVFQEQLDSIEGQLKILQTTINEKMTSDDGVCSLREITELIRGHKFQNAEGKLLELRSKDKISNIIHNVYDDSSANADLILAFAKSLGDSDLQIRIFSALRDEIRSTVRGDPFKLITLVEAIERELTRLRTSSPEIKAKAEKVIDNAIEDIKVASVSFLKAAMVADKYQKNVEIENLANKIYNFRSDVSNEVMERVVDSVFGVVAAVKILDNIASHKDIPQVITGLTAIFNRFNFAGNLNHDATLDLASQLRKLQLREKYSIISQDLKDDVEKVIQQLPTCARNLYFHTNVCFWNKGRGEYMYAASSTISYDVERRSIYTWYPGDIRPGASWTVDKHADGFYFKNVEYTDEYIYASIYDYNKDMRYIWNWIPGNNTDPQSAWSIELDGEYCYVKSVFYNEYLIASAIRYDQLNSYVFTWKPGSSVKSSEYQWQIRNCG